MKRDRSRDEASSWDNPSRIQGTGNRRAALVSAGLLLSVGLVPYLKMATVSVELQKSEMKVSREDHHSRLNPRLSRVLRNDQIEETTSHGFEVGVIHSGQENSTTTTARKPLPPDMAFDEDTLAFGGPLDAMQWLSIGDSVDSAASNVTRDRCDWLWNQFEQQTSWMAPKKRLERYQHQAKDAGNYYRSSSRIFWADFVLGNWSQALLSSNDIMDDLDEYSTYVWVSGDQHLLNFGTWKNRHGDIVFGMNDFDEGAVHDFQVDILRLAVSIYDQVLSTLGSVAAAKRIVRYLPDSYAQTVRSYVGNEDALTRELTPETTMSEVKAFLEGLRDNEKKYSRSMQLKKYAKYHNGRWQFKKGTSKNPKHKLAEISSETEAAVRDAFSGTEYGGSLLKFGWSLEGRWDENYYKVLDVAARIGSGVGSYGVDRYYVLISGANSGEEPSDSGPFILDVKHQPPGSFRQVVPPSDAAWHDQHLAHAAARVTEAQRRLTAFTDPFTGWIVLDSKPFTVRERSPWKAKFDLDMLTDEQAFQEYVVQLGDTTATSHVRGNVAEAPGDFKHVIDKILGDRDRREAWVDNVVELASTYYEQVMTDFECFQSRVEGLGKD